MQDNLRIHFSIRSYREVPVRFRQTNLRTSPQGRPRNLPNGSKPVSTSVPNCTLDPAATPYCPQAANLLPIIRAFDDVPSYEPVYVKVVKDDREVSQNTTVAKGVSSLMGLLIATCGCPVHPVFHSHGTVPSAPGQPGGNPVSGVGVLFAGPVFFKEVGKTGGLGSRRPVKGLRRYPDRQPVHVGKVEDRHPDRFDGQCSDFAGRVRQVRAYRYRTNAWKTYADCSNPSWKDSKAWTKNSIKMPGKGRFSENRLPCGPPFETIEKNGL